MTIVASAEERNAATKLLKEYRELLSQLRALFGGEGSHPLAGRNRRLILRMMASAPIQMRLQGGIEQLLQQLFVFTFGTEEP